MEIGAELIQSKFVWSISFFCFQSQDRKKRKLRSLTFLSAQVREAEEAKAREKARREAEAKKQAKTRVLMSSLFDKVRSRSSRTAVPQLSWVTWTVFCSWCSRGP